MSDNDKRFMWQDRAVEKYIADNRTNWLVSATPGAGKTRFTGKLARHLLDMGLVRQIIVVVPSDALREQWPEGVTGQIDLQVVNGSPILKPDYEGLVVTYQQIAIGGALVYRKLCSVPTLVVLDEVHHAGDQKTWGKALREAFEPATRILGLTGTPWRRDGAAIPFVGYDADGIVQVDYPYEYGEAVLAGVCRPITFHAFDGEIRLMECGEIVAKKIGQNLSEEESAEALRVVYNPKQKWIPSLLEYADIELRSLREEVPDAGGLVVAESQEYARAYADHLQRITGEVTTLVISDDAAAKKQLDTFRSSKSPWVVAVRMISEGIDVPRLSVAVYAAKYRTPLFFRQMVGRIVRRRESDLHNATMFMPVDPLLCKFASTIEDELRHALDMEEKELRERQDKEQNGDDIGGEPNLTVDTSEAIHEKSIDRGDQFTSVEVACARSLCKRERIPECHAVGLARILREHGAAPTPNGSPVPNTSNLRTESKQRQEDRLRQEINRLVAKIVWKRKGEKVSHKELNIELTKPCVDGSAPSRDGFPFRNKNPDITIADLERIRDYCKLWVVWLRERSG